MKRNHQKAFLSMWNAFRFWQGFVYWKRTSSSAWSPSRGVGWSFWKVACLPWLILGSGTRNSSVQYPKALERLWCKVASTSGRSWNVLPWRELCAAMDWVSCVPQNPKVGGQMSSEMASGGGDWEFITREPSLWKECMSHEKTREGVWVSAVWRQWEENEEGSLQQTPSALAHWSWTFRPPELCKINVYGLRHLVCGILLSSAIRLRQVLLTEQTLQGGRWARRYWGSE